MENVTSPLYLDSLSLSILTLFPFLSWLSFPFYLDSLSLSILNHFPFLAAGIMLLCKQLIKIFVERLHYIFFTRVQGTLPPLLQGRREIWKQIERLYMGNQQHGVTMTPQSVLGTDLPLQTHSYAAAVKSLFIKQESSVLVCLFALFYV